MNAAPTSADETPSAQTLNQMKGSSNPPSIAKPAPNSGRRRPKRSTRRPADSPRKIGSSENRPTSAPMTRVESVSFRAVSETATRLPIMAE